MDLRTTLIGVPLERLKGVVEAMGLTLMGVVPLGPESRFEAFERWLAAGGHAGMSYMEQHRHCRRDPRELHPGSVSAVIVGLGYYQGDRFRESGGPRIAQYARLKDYHKVLRQKGERLLDELLALAGAEHSGRVVVDSAPVLERALAEKTGSGFIGKNTLFIRPGEGSFFLLAEILTTIPVTEGPNPPPVDPMTRGERGGCGTCRRCQVHCPTGALSQDYRLDANKCLSYWTIEHRGPLPKWVWPWLGAYVFGCDICQLVCPYNRHAKSVAPQAARLPARPNLAEMATMDQAHYERTFGGTPMTRAKREGLMRNALVAMHVTRDPELSRVIRELSERTDVPEVVRATIDAILEETGAGAT